MKPKNFPARKLARQLKAQKQEDRVMLIEHARTIRTKKNREKKNS